eukprot:1975749-Alexandrium_andersonii.AAC.1
MGLRSQQAPQGETSLSKAWNRRNMRSPSVADLGAGGVARSAAPPARSAQGSGVPVFFPRRVQALDKDVSPCGSC